MSKNNTYTIDASGKSPGRLAVEISVLLRGKNNPDFMPNVDSGNKVIITNTSKLKITREKAKITKYYKHSGYLGGIKEIMLKDFFAKDPNKILRKAVYGMLPKNKLRAKMIRRLKLFKENAKS